MDARFFDVLHDAGDINVLAVTQRIHVNFDGILQIAVQQHRAGARHHHGFTHVAIQRGIVVDDFHGAATQHITWADHQRIADLFRHRFGFVHRARQTVRRLQQVGFLQQNLEPLAVFRQIDGVRRGAEDRNAFFFKRCGQFKWRLPAQLHDHTLERAVALFFAQNLDHVFGGQRLEVQTIRCVVIGRHGFRIAVDHDGLVTGFFQRVSRVYTAVIELDPLPDAVRSAT